MGANALHGLEAQGQKKKLKWRGAMVKYVVLLALVAQMVLLLRIITALDKQVDLMQKKAPAINCIDRAIRASTEMEFRKAQPVKWIRECKA